MNFKKIIYLILSVLIFKSGETIAQSVHTPDLSKAIPIGATFVPPKEVQLMRGSLKNIDWKSLENKVVVLDFFDTNCSTCIESMPKLQKMQDAYPDQVQIINVTWQDKATMDKFFASNAYLKENKVNLPVIYSDTYFKELFPHAGVPHVAFLYKGKVQAITFSRLITVVNIQRLFKDGTIDLPYKNDFGKGSISNIAQVGANDIKAGVWISGYQNGVADQGLVFDKDSVTGLFKSSFYNRSIYRGLMMAWSKIKIPTFIVSPARTVWKVKVPSKYEDVDQVGEAWTSQNGICYERLDNIKRTDSLQGAEILNDLHKLLGIRSYWSTKKMECLILKSCPVKPYSGPPVEGQSNYHGSGVLSTFIDVIGLFPPVLDQVKTQEKLLIGGYSTLEELNLQLGAYGIEAVIGQGEMEVFVIEEVTN